MVNEVLTTAERVMQILETFGPYAFVVFEGVVIWKLWKNQEELHKRLEKKR